MASPSEMSLNYKKMKKEASAVLGYTELAAHNGTLPTKSLPEVQPVSELPHTEAFWLAIDPIRKTITDFLCQARPGSDPSARPKPPLFATDSWEVASVFYHFLVKTLADCQDAFFDRVDLPESEKKKMRDWQTQVMHAYYHCRAAKSGSPSVHRFNPIPLDQVFDQVVRPDVTFDFMDKMSVAMRIALAATPIEFSSDQNLDLLTTLSDTLVSLEDCWFHGSDEKRAPLLMRLLFAFGLGNEPGFLLDDWLYRGGSFKRSIEAFRARVADWLEMIILSKVHGEQEFM